MPEQIVALSGEDERALAEVLRTAIAEEAERLAASTRYAESAQGFRDLLERWKSAPSAGQMRDRELWKRFAAAREAFYEQRNRAYAERARERTATVERKEALIAESEALATSEDGRAIGDALERLMTEWKAAGHAGRDQEQALWERFSASRRAAFDRRRSMAAERDRARGGARAAKRALIEQAQALVEPFDAAAAEPALATQMEAWRAAGSAGRADDEELWQAFRAARDQVLAQLRAARPPRRREGGAPAAPRSRRGLALCLERAAAAAAAAREPAHGRAAQARGARRRGRAATRRGARRRPRTGCRGESAGAQARRRAGRARARARAARLRRLTRLERASDVGVVRADAVELDRVALEPPEVQAARRGRMHLQRAAPGPCAVGALALLGAARARAQRVQLEARDLGGAAGRDVHAGVEHAVQRARPAARAARRRKSRADDDAAQRVARALRRAVQLRVGDAEPGQERAGVAERLAAQQRVEVGGALVRAAQVGRERAGAQALVAQLLGQPVALGARAVGVGERLLEALAHVGQLRPRCDRARSPSAARRRRRLARKTGPSG